MEYEIQNYEKQTAMAQETIRQLRQELIERGEPVADEAMDVPKIEPSLDSNNNNNNNSSRKRRADSLEENKSPPSSQKKKRKVKFVTDEVL